MNRLPVILAITASTLIAQEQETVIRTETRVVLVDAVAVDRKNQFVRDLAQKDFRLWEDNKEQKIAGFSLESAGLSPERSNKHYIAMLFDTGTGGQSGQLAVRQEATRFVGSFASADRYMAVLNYANGLQIAQNFTADQDRLRKALAPVQSTAVIATSGMRDGNRPVLSAVATDANTSPYRNFLGAIQNLAGSLAIIKGRKALVVFSDGAPMTPDLSGWLQATIAVCNKANVAIYAVSSGGNSGSFDRPLTATNTLPNGRNAPATSTPQVNLSVDQNLLASLAEETGGLLLPNTSDLAASLGKVALEQDQYYLLSYSPAVESAEGSCHDLKLKVDRSDVTLRSRKSYCTAKPVDPLAGKPAGQALEAKAAAGAGTITGSMQLPWFYQKPGIAQVYLVMDFIPSAMKFRKEKGKLLGTFNLAGVATKADGSAAARFSDTVNLEFDTQNQADEFLKSPYHYLNQFQIGPGQYSFRMAFSSGAESFGKVDMPLIVEPWNGQTLSASGLALSRDVHPAEDLASGLDASLLEGQRPLAAKGNEIEPTGSSRFRAGESGFVYFEAYEPLLTAATAPVLVGARIRVVDRATGEQKYDAGAKAINNFERPGNPVVPVIAPLPSLPAGAYKMEVSVMRETGDPVVRTTDFTIE